MNTLKEKNNETKKKKQGINPVAKSFRDVLNGNMLTRDYVINNLPYFFFLTFLMLLYIGMGYNTEKNVRRISNLETELIELNSEFISLTTELNLISRQSQVADSAAVLGLAEMKDETPFVISVDSADMNKIY